MEFFKKLVKQYESGIHKKKSPVVVCAHEEEILKAIIRSIDEGIVESPILIGDLHKINEILKNMGRENIVFKGIDIATKEESSAKAVDLILSGEGDFLVKGLVDTSIILKAILNRKDEFKNDTGKIFFSHVTVAEIKMLERVFIFGDAAMNIAPKLEEKISIMENCYKVAKSIGINKPKIAILAAKEKVSPKMIATQDADEIKRRFENETRFIVEGPLALDNAVSKRASEIKGIKGKIQGDADILIMPNIEAGNIFYKALCYMTESKNAGILVGAKVPIVITSRADTEESKFLSIVLASFV